MASCRRRKTNVIVYLTSYSAQHSDIDWLIQPGKALDPQKYFIVIPDMLGNGLSTSPSNIGFPFDRGRYPLVTAYDNVHLQQRLLAEHFGIERIALVYGWSMGGQQAYHWAALFADRVERMACICGSARTSPHNKVFIEGVRSALMADEGWRDGWFETAPLRGFRAFARAYAGWALSQAFYRNERWREAGFSSLEDYLVRFWEWRFRRRDANDLLAQLATWSHGDIADNDLYGGDLAAALAAIKAKALVMPCDKDLYFRVEDNRREVAQMPDADLKTLSSDWGHLAGNPVASPADAEMLDAAVKELLAR